MKWTDRFLQTWRMSKISPWLRQGDCVLDIGTHQGELFAYYKHLNLKGLGIDPLITDEIRFENYSIKKGSFPDAELMNQSFDVLVMLAVLEHIPVHNQTAFSNACFEALKPGGLLLISVPSTKVDTILEVLKKLKLIAGMSLEEHFGFQPEQTLEIFKTPQFRLMKHKTFQLGLNHLFVFQKAKNQ